jgi:D-glycerate 3-kinase
LPGRLASFAARRHELLGRPTVLGLSGPQGSGKTTTTRAVAERLHVNHGRSVASLSLDDLYLSRAARRVLAQDVHPLLSTRGVPGTHDVELGLRVLGELTSGTSASVTRLPGFDKASDEPLDPAARTAFAGRADIVILEGWCLGARPQSSAQLAEPVNALERNEDPHAVWRTWVNEQLAGRYQQLFARVDVLVMFAPPRFERVVEWRIEQEHELAAKALAAGASASGNRIMSDADIQRFVQHFERLTRHMLAEMPGRADVVVSLGENREVRALTAG